MLLKHIFWFIVNFKCTLCDRKVINDKRNIKSGIQLPAPIRTFSTLHVDPTKRISKILNVKAKFRLYCAILFYMLQTKILELWHTTSFIHIASALNDSMEFIQSKNLKIVYLLTLRLMLIKIFEANANRLETSKCLKQTSNKLDAREFPRNVSNA